MPVDIGSITPLAITPDLVRVLFAVAQSTTSPPLDEVAADSPRWNFNGNAGSAVTLSYAFSGSAPSYDPGDVNPGTYAAMSQAEMDTAEEAMALWSQVAGVTFTPAADVASADIVFRKVDITQTGVAGFAFFPPQGGEVVQNGDVFLDPDGAGSLAVIVHELGHALGLTHPFEGGDKPVPEDFGVAGSQLLSIMDYTTPPRDLLLTVSNGGFGYSFQSLPDPEGPMPLDILAAQILYGSNTAFHAGNNTYSYAVDPVGYETIWDAGGSDTIDLSNQTRPSLVSLVEGSFSTIALRDPREGLHPDLAGDLDDFADRFFDGSNMLAIAFDTVIENATGGSAGDRLIGNGVRNRLLGNDGNDTLGGAAGGDVLTGGDGDDSLDGGTGNDVLTGSAGADALSGGTGNDIYVIGAGDTVTEAAGAGVDTLKSSRSMVLGANLENLVLIGGANARGTGNELANTLTGNGGNNLLIGQAGADSLAGGAGNDTLRGGSGNDTLAGGAGSDTFSFDTRLAAGSNVDRVADFDAAADTVQLDRSFFAALTLGAVDASLFHAAPGANSAQDAADRLVYDTSSGELYYDADGLGGSAAVRFAILEGHPALTAADFLVIA